MSDPVPIGAVPAPEGGVRHGRYPGFVALIKAVGTGERGRRSLDFEEARDAARWMLTGQATPAQMGGFLMALRIKGETPAELAGLTAGLREARPDLRPAPGRTLVCSAGAYDGISEAPALSLAVAVAAAAASTRPDGRCGVVLHCGDRLGPKFGVTPADVLAELGGRARPTPEQSEAMLERSGVALVHTAQALPGWARLAAVRDEVGPRGPVHSAEKLVDWFGARRFVVGYTHAPYAERIVGALELLDAEQCAAVRGIEGSDVMRPGRPSARTLDGALDLPEQLGDLLPVVSGAAPAAQLTRAALHGEADRVTQYAVVLSAALRLYVAGMAPTVLRALAPVRAAIADGRAAHTLDALVG